MNKVGSGALIAALLSTTMGSAPMAHGEQRDTLLAYELYRGEFHSHTSISDGKFMPEDAYNHVRTNSNADFFTLAEHDVSYDLMNSDEFVSDWREAASDEWRFYKEGIDAFNAEQQDLVVGSGYEMTYYDGTGHLNVYNTDWRITAQSADGGTWGTGNVVWDLPTAYARIQMDPGAVSQFNHPGAQGWGDFNDFNHLTPGIDEQLTMFEYKTDDYHSQWVMALDNGWHLSPTFSGDEHNGNWVTSNPAITGIWAVAHTQQGLYDAMRNRRTFASFDDNAVLKFSANGEIMGSILPAATSEVNLDVAVSDPDGEAIASIDVYSNQGVIKHSVKQANDTQVSLPTADGDYFWVKAIQDDGDILVSAPIWIGPQVRGANYAPEITLGQISQTVREGQRVNLPNIEVQDDSGESPEVDIDVFNAAGEVPVVDGAFTVEGYSDHYIRVRATDVSGSTASKLIRVVVSQDQLDPQAVFRLGTGPVSVGETPDKAGLTALTDAQIDQAWVQILPADDTNWANATTVPEARNNLFERDQVAVPDAPDYQSSITGHTIGSHEFDLTGLSPKTRYKYRFGVGENGPWAAETKEFVTGSNDNTPVYVLGDFQVSSGKPDDWRIFGNALSDVQAQHPDGDHVLQLGDMVDNAGRAEYWQNTQKYVWDSLDLEYAGVVGNHETYGDRELDDALSLERNRIFNSHVNQPRNGTELGESNYSYDRGDIHFSVINSNYSLREQIEWLIQDVRATDKPWKVVVGHFSYYGGRHADDAGMSADRQLVTKTLRQLGVQLYLGGHDHVYKRSTINTDGKLIPHTGDISQGTTFVTMGSAGAKFYENQEFWYDDVVDDEDVAMGGALQVTDDGLRLATYDINGDIVDDFTIPARTGGWYLSSVDSDVSSATGFGLVSYPGSRDTVTVVVASYSDSDQREMTSVRINDVTLDHRGTEQFIEFAEPMALDPQESLKVFVWDSRASAIPLTPAEVVRSGFKGGGTAENPFEIRTWEDVDAIRSAPSANYKLMNDLELDGTPRQQIGFEVPFTGVFDGGGHRISGFVADGEGGAGLFSANDGTIKNLAVSADIDVDKETAGIVADVNNGTIERVWTSGRISAAGRVGGIVGDSFGVMQDVYSTADVRSRSTEAGGVAGLGMPGSVTQRAYSTGNVRSDTRNVGGVVGYGYDNTTIDSVISLNASVTAPSYAHNVLGRVLSGQAATLSRLYASEATLVMASSLNEPPTAKNWYGEPVPAGSLTSDAFFTGPMGWDFSSVWDFDTTLGRPVLRSAPESEASVSRPELPRNEAGYYEIATANDLQVMSNYPGENYVLTADIDMSDVTDWEPIGSAAPFRGELDGAGHSFVNFTSTTGGVFGMNFGSVHDVAVVDATVSRDAPNAGLLVNHNYGTIERVYATGSVTAASRAGGLVGESGGTVRDAYTVADVHSLGTEAGGVIGVALGGSTSERLYAAGAVLADVRNVGGVAGYGYNQTVISDSIALNPSVTAPSWAHRFLGRVLSGHTATVSNNWGVASVNVAEIAQDSPTYMGATASVRQSRNPAFYAQTLGWDFEQVWTFDEAAGRPVLRSVTENYTGEPVPPLDMPSLPQSADGFFLIDSADQIAVINDYPSESFRLSSDLFLTGQPTRITSEFTGQFDGAGHTITGYNSSDGGLIRINRGTVYDVGLVAGSVTTSNNNVGLLVDVNYGTVERTFSSGEIRGGATVGGLIGYSHAQVRDAYSTASVWATGGRQAGGLIGITGRGSTTQRVYATGRVEVVDNQNAGGVSGYGYAATTIDSAIALNPEVVATGYGNRVLARMLGNEQSDLNNMYAIDTLKAEHATAQPDKTSMAGQTFSAGQLRGLVTDLGWDMDTVWRWDDASARPVLTVFEGK